jgi:hypothetical protein
MWFLSWATRIGWPFLYLYYPPGTTVMIPIIGVP